MSEPKETTHEAYQRARDAFDELNIEKKATFLVEAAVSTLARGLASASEALGSEFERVFETMEHEEAEAAADETTAEPPASEPKAKTTKRASSAKKTTSSAKKSTSTRSRSSKKKTPPKKS